MVNRVQYTIFRILFFSRLLKGFIGGKHARDAAADDLHIVCARLDKRYTANVQPPGLPMMLMALLPSGIIDRLSSPASSPPPAASAQDGITTKHTTLQVTPGSPTLSTTSTADGGSSPVLPALPAPLINGRALDLLKTPPTEPRTTSSRYFTASWGSPYPELSDDSLSVNGRGHRKSLSSDTSEDSPLRRLELHTPFLRPAPGFPRSQTEPALPPAGGVSAAVLINRARRPALGLTEDWIRQHTEAETTERLNWLSDSNGDSDESSEGGDWVPDELDPRTPTLKNFVERRGNAREYPQHVRQKSTDTLRQADFEGQVQQSPIKMSITNDSAALDPLGEMPARKSTARKHVQHSRAQSTTDSLRDILGKAVAANNRNSISSIPESINSPNGDQESPSEKHTSILDKELPPPPPEVSEENIAEEGSAENPTEKPAETQEWRAASLPAPIGGLQELAAPLIAESPSPVLRLKRKVPWRGKNIAILLPLDDERGQKGKAPTPMTPTDVERMLRDWEQLGYNVAGFNLGNVDVTDTAGVQGQSRSVWPNVEAILEERQMGKYRVSIPDRRMWEAYVEERREAKLRALGVSLGDEDHVSTISPPTSVMSRTASMQYPPLPFSPPIPPSSATSSHVPQHANLFSPALLPGAGPSTSQSSNVGSVASPASMHAQIYGKFNPRQSISLVTGEHAIGSPFQYGQQSSPGVWSPQQMLYQPGVARGGSPSLQTLSTFISPGSPFQQDGYFQHADLAMQMQHRQQQLQNQLQLQMNQAPMSRQSSRFQEISEHDGSSTVQKSPSKTPEASQFIRHNASDSLQKEIEDAEYHLEEQMQRELEHEDYSPHSEKGDGIPNLEDLPVKSQAPKVVDLGSSRYADDEGPVLHHPQPHSRGHSLSQRPFGGHEDAPSPELGIFAPPVKLDTTEVENNSSGIGTPLLTNDLSGLSHERSLSNSSNPWLDSEPFTSEPDKPKGGHAPKPSISKLNVAAPEFKFDPTKAFNPAQFSFGTGFKPAVAAPAFMPPTTSAVHALNGSIGSGAKPTSKINVAAPEFKPGQSTFSFSSSGPTFRPDAPAFTPIRAAAESVGSGQSSTEGSNPRASIFGKIDMMGLAGIIRPPKKSKAVPIIRPDSAGSANANEDEPVEDGDGRVSQNMARMKRAKGSQNDADSVPLFAEPSPEPTLPLQETSRDQSPPKEVLPLVPTQANKENTLLEADKDALRVIPPSAAALSAVKSVRKHSILQDSPDYDGKGWAPWELDQAQQVEQFNNASAFPVRALSQQESNDQNGHANGKAEEDQKADVLSVPASVEEKPKGHKKNSLSALAKPFEFSTPSWFKFGSGSSKSNQAPAPPVSRGLSSSRYAASPSPPPPPPPAKDKIDSPEISLRTPEKTSFQESLPQPRSPPPYQDEVDVVGDHEPTFEEIDAVMRHMNEEPSLSISRDTDTPRWHQPSPSGQAQILNEPESSPIRLQPQNLLRSDAPSPSPRRFQPLPGDRVGQRVFSRTHDDPFVGESLVGLAYESPVHNLNPREEIPASDWDGVLSESEEGKFQARTQFFDGHVNDLVGGLLAERLDPLEKALETIQLSLATMAERTPSSRRTTRSFSGELPESDADDEDDEQEQRRSTSPRKDSRKWEKMRSIIKEVLTTHQSTPVSQPLIPVQPSAPLNAQDSANVLQVLEEMREQFGQSMRLDLRGEDLRNIVEEAVERRMPATPKPMVDEVANAKIAQLEARILELNQKVVSADEKTEEEIKNRRAAEDRLAEVQRLLRISSEEEDRLREAVNEKDQKLKTIDETRSKSTMRTTLLEANVQNAQKSRSEMANKLGIVESELRQSRQDAQHWQIEAEKALDAAKRHNDDAEIANEMNAHMRRTIESLKLQMEESLRVRESMRVKLGGLQEEMARAAREISQENAKRAKKEQELIARQEVLDARLQAEARTRERLEKEIERLENGEREGMRAVSDSKRLETLVSGLQQELHEAQKISMRYQREFDEARESGLNEVQRTRHYMQAEIEAANNQVNVVRQDLEDQVSRLRAELDHVKLEADTAKARNEMLLEEALETKRKEVNDLSRKHENEIDDLQTQHERQLGNAIEDHQRSEQQFLERLSLSSSKVEHLQDRVSHLEEKLEIAKAAAHAAAQAARSASVSSSDAPQRLASKSITKSMELPEKISPQALRESIMVLQEQLQDREQTIEKLEQKLSTVDLDAPTKISKRDDEITWLRELLAVRVGDLQDIINIVSEEDFDPATVKDAAIRLKANLQMEQQERERAMSGTGYLPNIAASIKEAATPRVAQVVGPMAAAWGNWRKSQETGSTPSKASPQSFLSGLLTPPASSVRTPTTQPTAFNSTGRRFTAQQLANRPSRRQEKMPAREGPPSTPPMMRKASYDQDAHAGDFSDAGFYDDENAADVDDGMFAAAGR